MNSPKPIYKLLNGEKGDVADLITRARQLARLNRQIQAILDQPLTDHCQVARCEDNVLVLSSDSPVWAARLRYYIPTLLLQLKQNIPALQGLKDIKIVVHPTAPPPAEAPQSERKISSKAAESISAMAQTVDNPGLRAALERLARPKSK